MSWSELTPAPAALPAPTPPPTMKRRRTLRPRQTITDQAQVNQAAVDCQLNSGNAVVSCFPTAETVVPQHQWASFVWNSRRPELTQINLVNIFLFRADSQEQVLNMTDQVNPSEMAGVRRAQVDDAWFGTQGLQFNGTNITYPFYWIITRADVVLDGNAMPQATFTAVQTAVLDSVAAAQSSAASASSASASSASAAAASSASAASASSSLASASSASASASRSSASASPTPGGAGSVQHAAAGAPFPRWAIAVIVVLGFAAIAATCILAFLVLRRLRRARDAGSARNSIGSASPMMPREQPDMAQRYDAGSPLLPPPAPGGVVGATSTTHDAASTISDSGGPFSGADAAIMADAFRKMLRKPDFAEGAVAEGDSPGADGAEEEDVAAAAAASTSNIVLSRELAEEGRDIRSVSSSRGVKVETRPER